MSNRDEFFSYRALELEVCNRFLNVSMPGASHAGAIVPVAATGTVTFSAGSAETDTVTIGGIAVTISGTGVAATDAAAFAAAVNASTAAFLVTTSVVGGVVTLTAVLSAAKPGLLGNSITLTKTGTNVAVSGATMTGGLTGLLAFPDNKGILAMYQLNAGYYMLVLQDNFKAILATSWEYQVNSATPPAVDAEWTVVENATSRSSGHLLLSSMVNADTLTVNNNIFTCTTAAQASNVTFQVGANDAATAVNLAATINGVTSLGVPTGFGKVDNTLSATAIALSGNGGAVLVKSTQTSVPWALSAHGTITPTTTMAAGPGAIVAFFGAGGSTPTDPAVGTVVKAHIKLRRV